jgi:hypothetical protein
VIETIVGRATSTLETDRREPSTLGPDSHCEVANRGRDQLVSIWLLTLGLFLRFLGCSLVVALLAIHFGWLGSGPSLIQHAAGDRRIDGGSGADDHRNKRAAR